MLLKWCTTCHNAAQQKSRDVDGDQYDGRLHVGADSRHTVKHCEAIVRKDGSFCPACTIK